MQALKVSDTLWIALWRRGKSAAFMHHSGRGNPSAGGMKKASLRWLLWVISQRSIAGATGISVAAAVATTAGRTGFHRASNVDGQVTTTHILAMHGLDSRLGFRAARHLDKAKAFRATCVALHHDLGRLDLAKGREVLVQIVVANRVRQVANIKLVAHFEPFKKAPCKVGAQVKTVVSEISACA